MGKTLGPSFVKVAILGRGWFSEKCGVSKLILHSDYFLRSRKVVTSSS